MQIDGYTDVNTDGYDHTYGCGDGYGDGDGDAYGSGDGDGYGCGDGYGDGDGYGCGYAVMGPGVVVAHATLPVLPAAEGRLYDEAAIRAALGRLPVGLPITVPVRDLPGMVEADLLKELRR